MKSASPLKTKFDAPLTKEELKEELTRLSAKDALKKQAVFSDVLFPTVEGYFRNQVDRNAEIPYVRASYLYMSDEGFLTVLAVIYSLSRAACKELFAKAEKNGEHVFLTFRGKTDQNAPSVEAALALSQRAVAFLRAIAEAAGFSLLLSVTDGVLEARFCFSQFRAVPVASYSCSEDYVTNKTQRALRLFKEIGAKDNLEASKG